jgi:hypothetical protein
MMAPLLAALAAVVAAGGSSRLGISRGAVAPPPKPSDVPKGFVGYGAVPTANPLKSLPPLRKPHHAAGSFNKYFYDISFADGILLDYARITGSVPIELGYFDNQTKGPPNIAKAAVDACHRATLNRTALGLPCCSIAFSFDPWIWKYSRPPNPLDDPQRDPASRVREQDELDFFRWQMGAILAQIEEANKLLGASVAVGAMLLDSEEFVWKTYPDGEPSDHYWADLARKNELVYNLSLSTLQLAPDRITFYSRGSVEFRPDLNATECLRNRPEVAELQLSRGHCMATDAALATSFAESSPFCATLYSIAEPELTRQEFVSFSETRCMSLLALWLCLLEYYRR